MVSELSLAYQQVIQLLPELHVLRGSIYIRTRILPVMFIHSYAFDHFWVRLHTMYGVVSMTLYPRLLARHAAKRQHYSRNIEPGGDFTAVAPAASFL